MWLRRSLWQFYLSFVAACVLTLGIAKAQRPNVLFMIADDWSYPHASALGDSSVRTPVFDRIAREGVLFEHAFVSAPSCTSSRSAILAGQHHWRLHGAANLGGSIRADVPLISDLLVQQGYALGKFGKGVWPSKHVYRSESPLPQGHERFDTFLARREPGQPFFYWYGGSDPHRPYEPGMGIADGIDPSQIKLPACLPDAESIRSDVSDYYGEVQRFDRECGELLAQLAAHNELDNTIVIMTSDNGMPFPRCKATLYDLGTRVPLAIMWPKRFAPKRQIKDFVSLIDLAPTILDFAGIETPATMNAQSFVSILESRRNGWIDRERNFVLTGMERHVECNPQRALRTDKFLLIKNYYEGDWPVADSDYNYNIDPSPTKSYMLDHRDEDEVKRLYELGFSGRPEIELYDLQLDPEQMNNVAEDPAYASVLRDLKQQLTQSLADTDDPRRDRKGRLFEVYRQEELRLAN